MAQSKDQNSRKEYLMTILSKVGIDITGEPLDYKQFEALCVKTFNAAEVEQYQQKVQEIFHLFDANADGILLEDELLR
jgi:Ca2+-binding EF-hand superfamily protein